MGHADDLVWRLDGAGLLGRFLAVDDLDAEGGERVRALRIELVDGEPAVAAAVGYHQVRDLACPQAGTLAYTGTRREVEPACGRPDLVNDLDAIEQTLAALKLEHHHRPLGSDEDVTRRPVHGPHLHVPRTGGIAHVEGVYEDAAGHVSGRQLGANSPETVLPDAPLRRPISHRISIPCLRPSITWRPIWGQRSTTQCSLVRVTFFARATN